MSCKLFRKHDMKKYLILFSFFAVFFNLALFSTNTYAASGNCIQIVFKVKGLSPTNNGETEKKSDWLCVTVENDKSTSRFGIRKYVGDDRMNTQYASQYKNGVTALVSKASGEDSNQLQFHGGAGTAMTPFTVKTKGVKFDSIVSETKSGFSKTKAVVDNTQHSYKYSGVNTETLENVEQAAADAESNESDEASGEDADPCYSGAGVLGHMICPLLKAFGELADTAYVDLIQPALILEPELVSESSGTFAGWQIFQNFANIAFIIMLLIIVLSQVTGIGLSNYGIKKTLPKLVVAVVLINISYIMCQLAVDLSNVLGVGLKSLMDGLTQQIHETMELNEVVFNADATTSVDKWDWGSTLASLALLGGIIAGVGTLLSQGFAVLLPLLLVAVAVIIGIMFFFILLSVRKAGVVLLVVLSPIAFVCYMLPNTKKLFDKWYKAFTGLLLLFPICGLIIGGGDFASEILLSVNEDSGKCDFFFALTAMVIGVLPIFFIPLILKNSMTAMGNIGARLSNRGRALTGGINRRIGNSDAYKNTQAKLAAGRDGGLRSRIASKTPLRGQMARNRAAYGSLLRQQSAQRRALNDDYIPGIKADIEAEDFAAELQSRENAIINNSALANDIGSLQEGLSRAISNGDQMGIRAYQNVLSRKGEDGREAVHQAMLSAEAKGKVSKESAETYSSNLMNNWASDYMNSNRSTFDYAKKNQAIGAIGNDGKPIEQTTMAKNEATSARSLKASNLPGTDEGELRRYLDKLQEGSLSEEEMKALSKITDEAMSNENIRGSLKDKQLELVQDIHNWSSGKMYGPARPSKSQLEGDSGKLH